MAGEPAEAQPETGKGCMGCTGDAIARGYASWARLMRLDKATIELATTSNFVAPRTLFITRAVLCTFMWCVWIASLTEGNPHWHIYFTYLSYTNTLIYFTLAVALHIFRLKRPDYSGNNFFTHAAMVTFEMSLVSHVIVPIVYWTLLAPDLSKATSLRLFVNIGVHVLDVVVVITDFLLNRVRLIARHSFLIYALSWCYIFYALVVFANEGVWAYNFLDYTKPVNLAFYFGLTFAAVGLFFMWQFFQKLRDRELRRCCGGRSRTDAADKGVALLDVPRPENDTANEPRDIEAGDAPTPTPPE